ncbi:MAG: 5'/3'-nucleotidase SurE [Thermoprotei archaeon ex4572_64]|nr:MAG: 5'/3'-nucleotidase SurE [Thermoprotei archaeon ex4572_64]
MYKILITSDDGIFSCGVELLYHAVKDLGKVCIVVPEKERSACSLSLTLHKPLRVRSLKLWNVDVYIISGTPADCVCLGLLKLCEDIDIVLSGINLGDNTSLQAILASGTVGAIMQAYMFGIPGIAFSTVIENERELLSNDELVRFMKFTIHELVKHVLNSGRLRKSLILNVNFPSRVTSSTMLKYVRCAKLKMRLKVDERFDPKSIPYYWLYGEYVEAEKDTDYYVVHVENNVAITPLVLDLNVYRMGVESYLEVLESEIKQIINEVNSSLRRQSF